MRQSLEKWPEFKGSITIKNPNQNEVLRILTAQARANSARIIRAKTVNTNSGKIETTVGIIGKIDPASRVKEITVFSS